MKKHDNMWVVQCIHMVYKEIDEKGWHNNLSKNQRVARIKLKYSVLDIIISIIRMC